MRKVGKKIMTSSESAALNESEWNEFDITKGEINNKSDLVVASYILNELCEQDRLKAVDKLWDATDKLLIILEPGTKVGFSNLKKIKNFIKKLEKLTGEMNYI